MRVLECLLPPELSVQAGWTQNAEPQSWPWGEECLSQGADKDREPSLCDPRRGLSGVSQLWPLAIFLLRHEKDQLVLRVVEGSLEH